MTFDRLQKLAKMRQAIVNSRISEAREQARLSAEDYETHTAELISNRREMDQALNKKIEEIVDKRSSILAFSLLSLEYQKNEDWTVREQEKNAQLEQDKHKAQDRLEALSNEFKLQTIKEKKMKFAMEKLSSHLRPTEPTEG